jgi:hypothetical protein
VLGRSQPGGSALEGMTMRNTDALVWNVKESLGLKTEIWEASELKWNPWVVNEVPQGLYIM